MLAINSKLSQGIFRGKTSYRRNEETVKGFEMVTQILNNTSANNRGAYQ